MFKGFYGWSLENVNKGTVDTKYIVEYINDEKIWNKFLKSEDPDLYSRKEYNSISDALTFYLTWYVNENCFDIKMWEQIFVNGEMVLEQMIEPVSTCKFNMRQSLNREMENRMREAERHTEELERSNEAYKKFLDTIDCGQFIGIKNFFRLFLKEYVKSAEREEIMSTSDYIRSAAKKDGWIKYLMLLRPVSIGTCPKFGMMDFINYDSRMEINGIMAWAEVYYNRELTEQELRDFEMVRG